MNENSLMYEPAEAVGIEAQVLGCLMVDNAIYPTVIQWIPDSACFYKEHHRFIYKTMVEMFKRDEPVDQLTLHDALRAKLFPDGKIPTKAQDHYAREIEKFGGVTYLAKLASEAGSSVQAEYHSKIISDRWQRRTLTHGLYEQLNDARGKAKTTEELIESIGSMIFQVHSPMGARGPKHVKDIIPNVLAKIGHESRGIPSGWKEVDDLIGGFKPTKYYVIAARTSVGKSTFALQLAMKAGVQGHPAAVFSLEMEENENVQRMLAYFSSVNERDMMEDRMDATVRERVHTQARKLEEFPIWVDDDPDISPSQLLYKLRRLKHDHDIQIAFIDYLQLVIIDDDAKVGANREQQVSSMSRAMKAIAKKLDIPVVVLAQLSRKTEARWDKRPELQDLRESGSIEQDSDVVMFIYRPDFSGADSAKPNLDSNTISDPDETEIIIAKQRGGRTGTVSMKWNDDLAIIQGQQEYDDYQNSKQSRSRHSKKQG